MHRPVLKVQIEDRQTDERNRTTARRARKGMITVGLWHQ